ncbi:methyltransferase [Arenicella chitinivorans]|uniref:Methyltransferase n=1 Tax=Arenicella chitinivorans TaxID=1329800 RepID=A0A918VJ48_9GAMM|nr:class I SAM-dependent methyltransferase [Arenicella chitinivorans]GHA00422.1 methyltransferase [Arenicella chitinivorans]
MAASSTEEQIVTDYWNSNIADDFFGITYWLANPLISQRFNQGLVEGLPYCSWINYSLSFLESVDCQRILGIGCGSGELELRLAELDAAQFIDGVDLSDKRIEIANQRAKTRGIEQRVKFHVQNAEKMTMEPNLYDAIYFNSSLHHMADLDAILLGCARALKPTGYLFVNEYIGPNRFDFSEHEKKLLQSVFNLIPQQYRVSHDKNDRGEIRNTVGIPNPEDVARVDPSEAICSAQIDEAIHKQFRVIKYNPTIGALMQFLLNGIAGNFRESDSASVSVLEMLFDIEERLMEAGSLKPHFAFYVAQPNS